MTRVDYVMVYCCPHLEQTMGSEQRVSLCFFLDVMETGESEVFFLLDGWCRTGVYFMYGDPWGQNASRCLQLPAAVSPTLTNAVDVLTNVENSDLQCYFRRTFLQSCNPCVI